MAGGDRFRGGGIPALACWLAVPSLGFIQEHAGTPWVFVYVGLMAAGLWVGLGWVGRIEGPLRRWFPLMAGAFALGLLALHAGLHPLEDGRGPGRSSDRDEALELAVGRLLAGENPYYPQNDIAGPLSVLPGGVILAVPFVLVGKVGWINGAALLALLVVLKARRGSAGEAWVLMAAAWFGSAAGWYEFVSGGDLVANGIYVALACLWVWREWTADRLSIARAVAAAAFLGVAVASRANFPLLCPLLLAALGSRAGWRRAALAGGVTALVSLGLIGGFYLWDPAAFTPLLSRGKLAAGDAGGWTGMALLGLTLAGMAAGACWLATRRNADPDRFFRAAALLLAVPVAGVVVIDCWRAGALALGFLSDRFGLMWIPFVLLGQKCRLPSEK